MIGISMQPCYFYIDFTNAKTLKNGKIQALCLNCGNKQKDAWFWNKGYGDFSVVCHKCNQVIHQPKNENCHNT